MGWIKAGKISDIPEGKAIILEAGAKQRALFNSGGKFYAIDNICPHKGASLAEGYVENCQVTCAWHAWSFELDSGKCLTLPGVKLKTYPVKIEKGDVFVQE